MKELQAVIIEDELKSREILRQYLAKYCENVRLLGEASNIEDGEKLILRHKPHLVFLDVEMPFGSGFDLLQRLDSLDFEVIFITAFGHYAIKAINLSASYYILKPIDIDELKAAVSKVYNIIFKKGKFSPTGVLAANLRNKEPEMQKLLIPLLDGFELIDLSDIIRAEAAGNYTDFHLIGSKKITVSKTLKYFDDLLEGHQFFRSHKSHLVNLAHIKKYHKGKSGYLVMTDGSEARVAPGIKKDLLKNLSF